MRNGDLMISLKLAEKADLQELKKRIQEAFGIAVVEKFGEQDELIPTDLELEEVFYASDTVIYHILQGAKKIGGAVLGIHPETQYNSLEFFFIFPEYHNKGFGQAAWEAIERKYPDTEVWETVTPYFEKRNIHFYVNKCGFKIIEFWNKYYPEPGRLIEQAKDEFSVGCDEAFHFEKIMR